jgi:hypothetical protein
MLEESREGTPKTKKVPFLKDLQRPGSAVCLTCILIQLTAYKVEIILPIFQITSLER